MATYLLGLDEDTVDPYLFADTAPSNPTMPGWTSTSTVDGWTLTVTAHRLGTRERTGLFAVGPAGTNADEHAKTRIWDMTSSTHITSPDGHVSRTWTKAIVTVGPAGQVLPEAVNGPYAAVRLHHGLRTSGLLLGMFGTHAVPSARQDRIDGTPLQRAATLDLDLEGIGLLAAHDLFAAIGRFAGAPTTSRNRKARAFAVADAAHGLGGKNNAQARRLARRYMDGPGSLVITEPDAPVLSTALRLRGTPPNTMRVALDALTVGLSAQEVLDLLDQGELSASAVRTLSALRAPALPHT